MFSKKSHEIGQIGEQKIETLLNDIHYFSYEVERRGGTKSKTDFCFYQDKIQKNISGKSKSSIKNGSFDWANITSHNSVFGDYFDEFEAKIKHIRLKFTNQERAKHIKPITEEFKKLCDQSFDYLSMKTILSILKSAILSDIHHVIVDDRSANIFYHFYPEQYPLIINFNEIESVSLVKHTSKLCASRNLIYITKDGMQHDDGIRFRVCYNNGMRAKLGANEGLVNSKGKPKNNNSTLCIKIQQDKTSKLLTQLIDCKRIKYDYDKQTNKYFRIT
jgi:hypothetical protein